MKLYSNLLVGGLVAIATSAVNAEKLAGQNYVGGAIGLVDFDNDYNGNDARDFNDDSDLDDGLELDFFANFGLSKNLDFNLGLGYGWADADGKNWKYDFSATEITGGVNFFFKPGNKFNPYAGGGLQIVRWSSEVKIFDEKYEDDDVELGIYGEGGIEIDFHSDFFTRFGGAIYTADYFDGLDVEAMGGFKFTPSMLGMVWMRHGLSNDRPDRYMIGFIAKT